ncbi:MAG: DUF6259 domain-containing protein [Acidobacteria bacterium]|nr:DUF6259 domain-containing protein [Acidobacteriota bacterium]
MRIACCLLLASLAQAAEFTTVNTKICTLRLDARSGDLRGVRWKSPEVELIGEPRLGENFRLLLPRPGYEANYFKSGEQQVSRVQTLPDGVELVYDRLRNAREEVAVSVRYRIQAVESRLEFSIAVNNGTDLPLAEVYFGVLGGQQGLGSRADTEAMVPGGTGNVAPGLFQRFQGGGYGGGNLGIRYSAGAFTYPGAMTMSWVDFFNRKSGIGMYYADHDVETRLSALYCELHPYNKTAVLGDNWPTAADVPVGEPIGLVTGWMKFPYAKRGLFEAGPVVVEVHRGGWQAASGLYRTWFDRHFAVKRPATWLRREMAWQSVILSNSEDEVVWRFRDLPRLAAEAKKYGVTTFEILGWDRGGIDRGYPEYTPDPKLGTADEFRVALVRWQDNYGT